MGDKSKNVRETMVEDTINNREMEQESLKEKVLRKQEESQIRRNFEEIKRYHACKGRGVVTSKNSHGKKDES